MRSMDHRRPVFKNHLFQGSNVFGLERNVNNMAAYIFQTKYKRSGVGVVHVLKIGYEDNGGRIRPLTSGFLAIGLFALHSRYLSYFRRREQPN